MFSYKEKNCRAAVIMPPNQTELCFVTTFTPNFMKGDHETQCFAKRSRHAMNVGGVSVSMSDKLSVEDSQRIVSAIADILKN